MLLPTSAQMGLPLGELRAPENLAGARKRLILAQSEATGARERLILAQSEATGARERLVLAQSEADPSTDFRVHDTEVDTVGRLRLIHNKPAAPGSKNLPFRDQ